MSDRSGSAVTFEQLGLSDNLLRGIYASGFTAPSAIQIKSLPPLLIQKRHVVAQAPSGTGKSTMIAMAALQCTTLSELLPQVVVLSPTRELASQTVNVANDMGVHMTGLKTMTCVGGTLLGNDLKQLDSGVHIVSGTPGRVLDVLKRGALNPRKVKMWVLDEADELLKLGFREAISDIFRYLSSATAKSTKSGAGLQCFVISATISKEVLELVQPFFYEQEPVKILVRKDQISLEGIRQFYVDVEKEEWKFETLCDLYDSLVITQAVIFCNNKSTVDSLSKKMTQSGFTVAAIHGDLDQTQRNKVMDDFRKGEARVLIATDLWSRGLDVSQISLVINYDVPRSRDVYLHRIGRSGRYGRRGVAINLVTADDRSIIRELEDWYKVRITQMPRDLDIMN
eukprot:ANDGO_06279.mRNA.1 DEAD-box ATP-dependent RNA helicase 2